MERWPDISQYGSIEEYVVGEAFAGHSYLAMRMVKLNLTLALNKMLSPNFFLRKKT